MRPRKVIVQLEVLTDVSVRDLEHYVKFYLNNCFDIPNVWGKFTITEKPKVNVVKK